MPYITCSFEWLSVTGERKGAAHSLPRRSAEFGHAVQCGSGHSRRIGRNLGQLAHVRRPVRFVWLRTFQHVVLAESFFNGGPNCQTHRHKTDAVLAVSTVKSGLIKIEFLIVGKAV